LILDRNCIGNNGANGKVGKMGHQDANFSQTQTPNPKHPTYDPKT